MENKQRLTSLILTVVLLGLNLAALNYLIAGWTGARLDLTERGSSRSRRRPAGYSRPSTRR